MTIIEELDKQGQFLFKFRSYLPGFIILISFFFLPNYQYPNNSYEQHLLYLLFCFIISLSGLIIRSITIGYVPKNTSGRNRSKQVADTLNQDGIYSILRHPLYVGNFFMHSGVALIPKSLSLYLIFFFIYWFYYERIIITEENFLRKKFGEKYIQWASRTSAFFPNLLNYKSSNLDFSFRNVVLREYSSLFGTILIFVLFDILIMYSKIGFNVELGINFLTSLQKNIIIIILSLYIFFRIIIKKTNFFSVEGR